MVRAFPAAAAALLVMVSLPGVASAQDPEVRATGDLGIRPLPARVSFKDRLTSAKNWFRAWRAKANLRPAQVARACTTGTVSVMRTAARLGGALGRVAAAASGVGGLVLSAYAGWDIVKARTTEQRFAALGDLGQGMCGLARLGYLARPLMHGLGTLGATLQCGAGAFEIYEGIRHRSRDKIVLGSMDIGAGLLFGASALGLATPYTLVAAVAVTAARFLYAKRKGIATGWDRLRERWSDWRKKRADKKATACAPPSALQTAAAKLEPPVKAVDSFGF